MRPRPCGEAARTTSGVDRIPAVGSSTSSRWSTATPTTFGCRTARSGASAGQQGGRSGSAVFKNRQRGVINIYFDFTCPYSRRTGRWWRELQEEACWKPFLLREAHRADEGPPEWEREDALDHVSVLALALHEAVEVVGGDVDAFRWRAMELFEDGQVNGRALRELASSMGGRDWEERIVDEGLRRVGQSHQHAVGMRVFGAPTLVSDSGSAYLKLVEQPAPDRARVVYEATMTVVRGTPEVAEIKRPA